MACSQLARLFAAASVLAGLVMPLPAAADPRAPEPDIKVFVPSFWDPGAMPEKPKVDDLGSIRFVTEDDHPPFGFTLPDGTLAGFGVDLARALCDELGVTCTIQVRRYDTIVPALKARAADAALASMAITEQALANVDFTAPYYRTPARFVARMGQAAGPIRPETIQGKSVAVARGTAHEAYLQAAFPAARIVGFDTVADVRAALQSGASDLAFGDGIGWAQWLAGPQAKGCCVFVDGAFTESRFFGEGAGIAVRKGNDGLRRALDYALARLAARGTYADLYLKYFPIGIY